MTEGLRIKSEWFFEYGDGTTLGPFVNSFAPVGLAKVAELIGGAPSPYLVLGDDTDPGFVITEVYRKPVSIVTRDDNVVRFRTQFATAEANGDHEKTCIYLEAADSPGTGTMLNMLRQLWSKTNKMILAVECRITAEGAS